MIGDVFAGRVGQLQQLSSVPPSAELLVKMHVYPIVKIVHIMCQDPHSSFINESFQIVTLQRVSPVVPGVVGIFNTEVYKTHMVFPFRKKTGQGIVLRKIIYVI